MDTLIYTIDNANLGIWIGPINAEQSAHADDEFIMS